MPPKARGKTKGNDGNKLERALIPQPPQVVLNGVHEGMRLLGKKKGFAWTIKMDWHVLENPQGLE